MDIRKAELIRCTGDSPTDCGKCESCVLRDKMTFVQQWVTHLSETMKQKYIRSLLHETNLELLSSLLRLLQPLQYKDFIYAKAKTNSTLSDGIMFLNSASVHASKTRNYMMDDEIWFQTASSWAKFNYLLHLIKFCNVLTLENLKICISKMYENQRKKAMSVQPDELQSIVQDKEEKPFISPSSLNSSHRTERIRSGVTFSPNLQEHYLEDDYCYGTEKSFDLRSRPISSLTSIVNQSEKRLSARCYPYTGERGGSRSQSYTIDDESEQSIFCDIDDITLSQGSIRTEPVYQTLSKQRDFIRRLPVHLSKYILGFLDPHTLLNCICVSKHWRFLAEQVRDETMAQQITREDVMLIQGSTENIPNPLYARMIPLHVPKLTSEGDVIPNDQAKHVDVTCDDEDFEERNMQNCYDGIETITVNVEERNVYCGAYNVLVLNNMKDNARVTFYDGGKFVPVASVDRRIRLLDVKSGRCEKTIVEHVGSVKSVCTNEKRGFVLSGSYDTTIRFWDIKSGRCQRIFLGHKSSVISLSICGKYLASGSTDRTCKVWNLKTGKCIRTFKHRNIIHSITIGEELLLTGCAGGKVRVWNFKGAKLVKSLDGHMGPITCTAFDEQHILTGSKDCYAMAWSTKGNFKRCLQTFRHPKEVNCLAMMFCRVITGSVDGKIRVWNILNGVCLRIIRGNSRTDPITALYASEDRLIINTKSNLLLYNFETVEWSFTAPTERASEFTKKNSVFANDRRRQSQAVKRALATKLLGYESEASISMKRSGHIDRSQRAQSAPVKQPATASIQRHISRIQSAVAVRKGKGFEQPICSFATTSDSMTVENKWESTKDRNKVILRRKDETNVNIKNAWNSITRDGLLHEKIPLRPQNDVAPASLNVPRVFTRSRSAPAHRIRSVPSNERGFTSSSEVNIKVWENKLNVPATQQRNKSRPFSATAADMKNPADTHCNLQLKTFYQQIEFEAELARKS